MKAFFASVIIFSIVLALIICNACFINHTMDELEQRLLALPDCEKAQAELSELQDYWDRHRLLIEISVSSDTVWQMCENLAQMQAASAMADAAEFELVKAQMLTVTERIRHAERFALENIF